MLKHRWVVVLFLSAFYLIPGLNGLFNLVVKKFGMCDSIPNYPNKIYATFRTVGDKQYLEANATFTVALDDNSQSNFTAELLVDRKYYHVVTIVENRTCNGLHKYVGEFAYELERQAQLVPGLCPIPPGRYHIHNLLLNFNQVTLQAFPFGHLRMKVVTTDKNNKIVACLIAEVENNPF